MVQLAIWFNWPLRPHHFFQTLITYNMGYTRRSNQDQYEAKIQDAIKGIQNKEFPSIRSATSHFQVSCSTLSNCLTRMQLHA